ncbi:MAG: hypothetical protein QOE59_2184 [Actinomycetota bacterium]|jgi:hypothetical protein|nr:hypothetical protein [Actinomycetota bacterium]
MTTAPEPTGSTALEEYEDRPVPVGAPWLSDAVVGIVVTAAVYTAISAASARRSAAGPVATTATEPVLQ